MKKLRVLLLGGNKDSEETLDLTTAFLNAGCCATHSFLHNILFLNTGRSFECLLDGTPLSKKFDLVLLRGSCISHKNELRLIVSSLLSKNITVLDAVLGKQSVDGKMYDSSLFAKNNLPHLKTVQILSHKQKKNVLNYLSFPFIAKPISASQGRGITLLQTLKEFNSFLLSNGQDKYLFQEYAPIQKDIRVFVVGNTALGAIHRNVIPGDVRSNASLGGKPEYLKLSPLLQNLAVRATHACKYDIAGVDILEKDGKFVVLEVNNAPQWVAFKKITGINPAPHIVMHAQKKYILQHPSFFSPI